MRIYTLGILLLVAALATAQGEANKWLFGWNAGLDFNSGTPVSFGGGQVFTSEGSASIADASGNLLFYTDGINVWDKTHSVMPNGMGLLGNSSSTQSGVIIQKPGSTNIYYIFAADAQTGAGGISYSEVDMTLSGGLGDITANKNIQLYTPSCEKITGIRHCNNKDIWIVTHDWNTDAFKTFLVTSAGVNPVPVVSNVGLVASGNSSATIGQLKGSPDGRRLASAIWESTVNRFEIFDFDNSTGIVSHQILLPQIPASSGAYGVEFSPDCTKLYATLITPGDIYQYDLCAGSDAAVVASGILIGQSPNNFNGSLQLGPDKRIYVAQYGVAWVGVINNPNLAGTACNYVNNGVSLGAATGSLGLPNFVPFYFAPAFTFTATAVCDSVTFIAPSVFGMSCNSIPASVLWNFGDPASGTADTSSQLSPMHDYPGAGTYTVSLIINFPCGPDTITQIITTPNCVLSSSAAATNISCNGQCSGSATVTATSGSLPYSYLWNTGDTTQSVNGLCAGTYTVAVTDAAATVVTNTVVITEPAILAASAVTNNSCSSQCNGSATVTVSGGIPGYTYSWNTTPVQATQAATGLCAGSYTCVIADSNGCSIQQAVVITASPPLSLSLSSQSAILCNGLCTGSASVTAGGGTPAYSFAWNTVPPQTGPVAANLCAGNYTCTVTDSNGCSQLLGVSLPQPSPLLASASFTPGCSGGNNSSASVAASGGTAPYSFAWTTTPVQMGNVATSLSPGTYTVQVTDSAGCQRQAQVIVAELPPVDSLKISAVYCISDPVVTLEAPGGGLAPNLIGGPYSWAYGSATLPNSNSASYPASAASLPGHAVYWFYKGCRYTSTAIDSTVYGDMESLAQTNVFSPNGDQRNDFFFPLQLDAQKGFSSLETVGAAITEFSLQVYDRWGLLVFESSDVMKVWSGNDLQNQKLTDGTYYWLLNYRTKCGSKGEQQSHKGFVQLIR
jgi:gliding motility-associated-like protein